jgi:peptide/nickel transport system ATP-binding protein
MTLSNKNVRPLLEVSDLSVRFGGERGQTIEAVAGTSFSVQPGTTLGIVGESGSGKSVTALALMRLLAQGAAHVTGHVRFDGVDLIALPEPAMQDLRGNRIAMIFQEPMTSLNPSTTIGDQIGEALMRHQGLTPRQAKLAAIEALRRVRMPSPEVRVDEYPHKLSGGMRQRAMIAMALACKPSLLIADEPTTALDVTIQAQILDLLRDLRDQTGTAIVLITHDLGVVAEMCDEAIVMYAGQIVEQAPVNTLFTSPEHPYTVGLLGSLPNIHLRRSSIGPDHKDARPRLATISGTVPVLDGRFVGCRFAPRCPFADDACRSTSPTLRTVATGHLSRCLKSPLGAIAA